MYTHKRIMAGAIVCLLFLAFLGGSAPRLAARSDTIVLSVWSFSDEVKKFVDRFENTYHGVKFDLTIIPYEEYLNKLKSAMKSGKNLPDLFTGEYGQIKEIVESGYWEDLSAAPYKADVSDMFPYLVQVGTDSKGKLRGLSWQITPGGFYFRRSAARKYLGTDVPENIGKMISTPEKFLATARRLKKKSGGKVKMIAGYSDYMQYPFAARTGPFVAKNNRLTIEPPIRDYFDMAKTMHDEGLTAGITMWSPPWFKMMYSDDPEFLGFFLPPWGLHYVIKPNAHDTDGDWGLCRGPGSFFWGGTWMGICSRSKYKKAAWEFLKFCTLDRENLRWWAKKTGDVVSSISVCKKIQANFSDPLLNGQNHYKFFTEQALRLKDSLSTPHTLEIQNYMRGAVKEYVNGKLNKRQALDQWRRDTKEYLDSYVAWKNPNAGKKEGAQGDFVAEKYNEQQPGDTVRGQGDSKYVRISMWSFTDEVKKYIDKFESRHPNVRIDLTIVPCEDYLNKLWPLLRSGRNAPDVFTAEYSNVVDLVESGFYDDLGKAPYNADTSEVYPYLVEVGTDSKGILRALSWQAVPGGVFYRRSIAKQYLGTDDPKKIGHMLSASDKFLATARLLKRKSGGRVKLIAGYGDYQQIVYALRKQAFVTNEKLNIEQCILDYFDLAKTMVDERLTADIGTWSPPWFENMNKKSPEFMCYILPTWGLRYVIQPNARDTMGDWGLCEGPAAYFWGGTWVGIYKDSKHKKLAWEFVKFMTLERDSQRWWAKETGDFVSNKTVVEKIKKDFASELLGGQNHYKFYARLAKKLDGSLLKKHDLDIRNFLMGAINNYVEGTLTKAEAIARFKADVRDAFPDVEVE